MLMLTEVKFFKVIFKELGRSEDSILDYSKAININPHFYVAFYNRGQYYYK